MHTYRSLYRLASTETEGVAAARASHAASPAELYWKIALPTSPMPGAIRDLINPARSASQEDTDMDEVSTDAVFFLEKDLFPGSKITLHSTRGGACAMVLLRGRADAIPFASEKLPEILTQLSVPAGSRAAEDMRTTLAECEAALLGARDQAKHCVTSLESMVEFAAASLGTRDIRAVSTEVIGTGAAETPRQEYTVEAVKPVVSVSGGNMVTCHGMPYAYAVFGCHTTTATVYAVTLAGADGTRAEALATCHGDAFPGVAEAYERVGVAAGSVPVCHIMPLGDMLWVRN
uniref:BURP domain-containing protein n=1 Tax=Oryza glumipatula TaxID=40148 RepID=A0A0D9ZVV7_9ORYZ